MTYVADPDRYEQMTYRRTGRSGLKLPVVSLGLWNNFGADRPLETSRAIVRRAFDLGITHFDLANNYGPPYGSAEEAFGRLLERCLGIETVRVEDVDVVEPHPAEALVEARQEVLARSPLAVGAGPHVVAGLRRDDDLVPVRR